MIVVIESFKNDYFKLKTCRFVFWTRWKILTCFKYLQNERYFVNDLEKWLGNTHGEISNIWIFEQNNDSLEFFSDLKINSFGARADINGTKERYHVRIFTIAFALCLCRWCIIYYILLRLRIHTLYSCDEQSKAIFSWNDEWWTVITLPYFGFLQRSSKR